jgi:hypothetical protein
MSPDQVAQARLQIEHQTTCDDAIGVWPLHGDGWVLISRVDGRTTWRRVYLQTCAKPSRPSVRQDDIRRQPRKIENHEHRK